MGTGASREPVPRVDDMVSIKDLYNLARIVGKRRHAVQISEEMMLYIVAMVGVGVLVSWESGAITDATNLMGSFTNSGSGIMANLTNIWNSIVHLGQ